MASTFHLADSVGCPGLDTTAAVSGHYGSDQTVT